MCRKEYRVKRLGLVVLGVASVSLAAMPTSGQQKAEASNMALVGYNDLQGRSTYQPVVQKQGERWIAYIGHQAEMPRFNVLTGKLEGNGTSIVDVTDPRHPKYIAHIPAEVTGTGEKVGSGGAEFVRVCSGNDLPHADKSKFYMMRNFGTYAWEMWDVTNPAKPSRLNVIVSGLREAHKSWWECDTGIVYLVGGPLDWLNPPADSHHDAVNHALIYDLSDPAKPVFIRSFGLPGQQPGSAVPEPIVGLHGLLSTGPRGNRLYFSNGGNANGILEIVDREKLLNGPKEPTDENLRYPVVGRIDFPPDIGVHNAFPLLQMQLPEFAKQKDGKVRDFVALTGETVTNECVESRQILRMFDVTQESNPVGVSTWTVPEASGNFCGRGGEFGTHNSNENFTPIYYKRVLFIAYLNAGVRALDIRDPYHPKEIGYYIPAVTDKTTKRCVGEGTEQHCKTVVQTNNVEVDDRGYIYIGDRANTGLHILELTGPARQLADFTKADGAAGKP